MPWTVESLEHVVASSDNWLYVLARRLDERPYPRVPSMGLEPILKRV